MRNFFSCLASFFLLFCFPNLTRAQMGNTLLAETHIDPTCPNTCNGSIDLSVSGGGMPITYLWSVGATTQDLSNLCAGTYTVTVTDAAGITNTLSVTLIQPPPIQVSTCVINAGCNGAPTGSITLTVTGGTPPYTYHWSNNSTTQNVNNLTAGTYTSTITDAHGCPVTISATVTQPPPPIITGLVTNASNGIPNGAIDITVSGGTPPYTYAWNDGENTQDIVNINPGAYVVTVTDAMGCTRQQSFTVSGQGGTNPPPIALSAIVGGISCIQGPDCTGSINLTVSGGTAPYHYQWSTNGNPLGGYDIEDLYGLCSTGIYCVTVVDASGTTASGCYLLAANSMNHLAIQSSNAAFCNYNPDQTAGVCEKVCPHTPVTYFITPPVICGTQISIQNVAWTVTGAESYTVSTNTREVNVIWGNTGAGQVSYIGNAGNQCYSDDLCITIVDEPKADFISDPPATAGTLQVCKGQTAFFKNQSLHADTYEWQFSDDLSTTSTENSQHTFAIPGNFTVTLIARSNCLCADTTALNVEVLDTEPPTLDCVGSVCPGETVTYSTSSDCSQFDWVVSSNGTIVDGGGQSDKTITIHWNSGPNGTISLTASGCSGSACPQASIFTVPVISDDAEIRGREFVCENTLEDYTIDQFDGVEYNWTLLSGGAIVDGLGTNKVTVKWTANANPNVSHLLIVDYYNCYLGCGGTDTIAVKILAPFIVTGPVEICEKTSAVLSARLANTPAFITCKWTVYRADGSTLFAAPGSSSSFTFPNNVVPGTYRVVAVQATPGQACTDNAELMVTVVAAPPKPPGISGPALICPGNPVAYNIPGNPSFNVDWQAVGASPVHQQGNPVIVTWSNSSTRWLAANFVSSDGLGCKSDTVRLNVTAPTGLSITGAPGICESTTGSYVADFYQGFDYQWDIIPASAGTVKQGQGKNAVDIFWQTPGAHQLKVTSCGLSATINVTVWPTPDPVILAPPGICPGDSATISTAVLYNSYIWKTAFGNALSSISTVSIPAGPYTVQVTDNHGCVGKKEFNIKEYPKPNVTVTTADPTGFCNNSQFVSLTALAPSNGTFTYDWTQDGVSLGFNGPVYVTNQYGQYTAIVTNQYGCTDTAPPVTLFNFCGGGGGGYCPNPPGGGPPLCAAGSIQPVPDPTPRCDSIRLVLNDYTGLYVPGSAQWWTGISGGNLVATASGDNAYFIYPNAGKYIVLVAVQLSNGATCTVLDSVDIEAVAQFSQKMACPGDSTRFTDASTHLPDASIVNWAWDFGETGSTDTSSVASPGYPYGAGGNYMPVLTVTTASGCTSTATANTFVPPLPMPSFAPPVINCAANASELFITDPTGIIKTVWDFGDPGSGALNTAKGNTVYHTYSPAGNYSPVLTATSNFGCKADFSQPINIIANPFSGTIIPGNSTICEGKSVTMIAPSGASANYVWNDGTNLQTYTTGAAGVYGVTLSNNNGCTYAPPRVTVSTNPAPAGTIKALDINDLGQVIGVSYPSVAVCAGENVTLQVQDDGNYSYQWSGGNGTNEFLQFTDDRGNLLSEGHYIYTVTVTNQISGCTAVFEPFDVTVNPVPNGFNVSTDNVCAGMPAHVTYNGPQPGNWQIFWNTGETGPVLTTDQAGQYFVRVVNEFGCSAQSNKAVIFPGPNVSAIPAGCHERCNPDTLCLPSLPEIVSWQWYFGGSPVPGATTSHFAATQSGTYYADMVDIHGCPARSADLTVQLYDGFGNILGKVWSDVNNNGMIDSGDTLVSFIPVQLLQNGTVVNTNMSDPTGAFEWQNVFATGYTVQIDTQALGSNWSVVIPSDSATLSGCGGKVYTGLLLKAFQCPTIYSSLQLNTCQGDTLQYNGVALAPGDTQDFMFNLPGGCDSVITVSVVALPISGSTLEPKVCPGSTYQYNGVDLAIGQTQQFTYTNYLGCDSIVTVVVTAAPTSTHTLDVQVCPGGTYQYQGVDLSAGQSQAFTLVNYLGCDSIVTVNVSALPPITSTFQAQTCPGSTFTYQGVDLAIGQSQNFTLSTASGCDSIVTVTVSAFPASSGTLDVQICPGSTYKYQGVDLGVGQSQAFTLTNYLGCDSMVTVNVSALPPITSTLQAQTCPGSTYQYEGVDLAIGQTQSFTLSTASGCDSIVTVTVSALPASTGNVQARVCPGSTYQYQGTNIAIGQTQNFTLANYLGCDSIVTVTVTALPTSTGTFHAEVCHGENFTFMGETLTPGQSMDFALTNYLGCDSILTVSVTEFPLAASSLNVGVCPNETFNYQGASLKAGDVQAFTLSSWIGCDSIVTVSVYEKASSAVVQEVKVCPGETYAFLGETLAAGQTKDFHFTNGEGCDSLITISVNAWPSLDFSVASSGSCPNIGNGTLTADIKPGGSVPVSYSINSIDFQADSSFHNLSGGNYTLSVQDENGCIFQSQALVPTAAPLEIQLLDGYLIPCDSAQITLSPEIQGNTAGLDLTWWNGAKTPSTVVSEAGAIWVAATNTCGETVQSDSKVDWADADGNAIRIYVPNVFKPEAREPENARFRAYFGNNLTLLSFKLQVYDRWGSLLFETEKPEDGWEGRFREKAMNPGVYVWQLRAKVAFCGREIELYKKGDVTIDR